MHSVVSKVAVLVQGVRACFGEQSFFLEASDASSKILAANNFCPTSLCGLFYRAIQNAALGTNSFDYCSEDRIVAVLDGVLQVLGQRLVVLVDLLDGPVDGVAECVADVFSPVGDLAQLASLP